MCYKAKLFYWFVQKARGKNSRPNRLRNLSWRKYWFLFWPESPIRRMLCVLNYPHGYVIHIYTCGVCVIRYPTKFSYAFFSFFLVCLFVLSMCVNAQRNFSPPNTSKRSFQPSEYKLYAHSILDMIEQNEECARFHKNPLILSKSRKKNIYS